MAREQSSEHSQKGMGGAEGDKRDEVGCMVLEVW